MASDLISRDALKEEIVKDLANTMRMMEMHKGDMALRVLNKIDEAPAVDAVEVVRCKDCRERTQSGSMVLHCRLNGIQTDDDDFCSYGIRREKKDAVD